MKCKTNICKACCCYNIPFEHDELVRFANSIVNPVLFTIQQGWGAVAFTHENPALNKCPFLRDDYRCNIYEERPEVCRLFGQIEKLPCKYIKL